MAEGSQGACPYAHKILVRYGMVLASFGSSLLLCFAVRGSGFSAFKKKGFSSYSDV